MSIRPVDFQMLIPKTQRLSQENQLSNNRERMEHQHLVQQDKKQTEIQSIRVNTFHNKNGVEIQTTAENNKDNPRKKNKKKKSTDKNNDIDEKEVRQEAIMVGRRIDIRI